MKETFFYDGVEYYIESDHKHLRRLEDNKRPNSQRFVAMAFLKQNNVNIDENTETTHAAVRKIVKFLKNSETHNKGDNIFRKRAVHKNRARDVILINNLFTGRYISKMDNIGHEFINIYKSDNGNYYIYANPYGNISTKWDDRIKYVIFVRSVLKQKKLQVIGYAEIKEQILKNAAHTRKSSSLETKEKRKLHHQDQIQYIKENDIRYGGIRLDKIFEDNIDGASLPYFITFKASNVYKATKEIILPKNTDGNMIYRTSESMKIYVSKTNKHRFHYQNIIDMINNENNWKLIEEKVSIKDSNNPSILSIVRKNYDENVISNFLAYIIENDSEFWKDFSKNILGIDVSHKHIL